MFGAYDRSFGIGPISIGTKPTYASRLHWRHCYQFKRNKVLDTDLPLKAIGVDGHEFFSTQRHQWPGFCERKHKTKNGEESEYYYRMVVCNLLNAQIDWPLDTEPILDGENEVATAKRLIERLCDHYTRFFDVVVADAFYMEGPFIT